MSHLQERKARNYITLFHPENDKLGTWERENLVREITGYFTWLESL